MIKTLKQAEEIAGSLGKPSKMPGYAYGLPIRACILGSKLRGVKNSVCSICYAAKGHYAFPVVHQAQEYRLASLSHPLWVEAMAFMINKRSSTCRYFRWHDSGDLQGVWHLANICRVALACPKINFWLPTREHDMVEKYKQLAEIPQNLVVRLSATMINGKISHTKHPHVSSVGDRYSYSTCQALEQGGRCLDCRNCWNPAIAHIVYRSH